MFFGGSYRYKGKPYVCSECGAKLFHHTWGDSEAQYRDAKHVCKPDDVKAFQERKQ
jgi:DNA-directed RNA polymerase subunit RPC12/RpoP